MKPFRGRSCAAALGCVLFGAIPVVAQDAASIPGARARMEVEVVTITDVGATPNAITSKRGPFILTLINRARLSPGELVLDSPNVSPVQLAAFAASIKLSSFGKARRLDSLVDAPPGIYQLRWKATGAVWLTITIE